MKKLYKLVLAAVLAALACVATMVIQIPSPMEGYINLGDCIVLISGWILGPVYGFFSAGIGSMLADLFSGYPHYAPGTFIIKGAVALCASLVPVLFKNRENMSGHMSGLLARLLGGFAGECIMVIGYFGYAGLMLGNGLAAAASIPGNIVQGAVGLVCALLLYEALDRINALGKLGAHQ